MVLYLRKRWLDFWHLYFLVKSMKTFEIHFFELIINHIHPHLPISNSILIRLFRRFSLDINWLTIQNKCVEIPTLQMIMFKKIHISIPNHLSSQPIFFTVLCRMRRGRAVSRRRVQAPDDGSHVWWRRETSGDAGVSHRRHLHRKPRYVLFNI